MIKLLAALFFFTMLFPVASSAQSGVLWLNEETAPVFYKGLDMMKKRLEDSEDDIQDVMERFKDIYVTGSIIEFDKKTFKLRVIGSANATMENNDNLACENLVIKLKKVLFGTNFKRYLAKYFPNIDIDDLIYLIDFKASINSYSLRNKYTNKTTEIDPDTDEVPDNAELDKKTSCSTALFSEFVIFD